jgi:hypothetical protein
MYNYMLCFFHLPSCFLFLNNPIVFLSAFPVAYSTHIIIVFIKGSQSLPQFPYTFNAFMIKSVSISSVVSTGLPHFSSSSLNHKMQYIYYFINIIPL